MADIELRFTGTENISKEKPFEDSEFLYLTTQIVFGDKLALIVEELANWRIDEHQLGEAYFAGAREVGDKTIFSLRMTYRSLPQLTKDESTQLLYDIIESFTVYLNEIEWLVE
jgi:hypothetical protein